VRRCLGGVSGAISVDQFGTSRDRTGEPRKDSKRGARGEG